MITQETKATRLAALAQVVDVPNFVYVARGEAVDVSVLPQDAQFMVRGVSAIEDSASSSHAGQFVTIGPVALAEVAGSVATVFDQMDAEGVLVQVFVSGVSGVAFCFGRDDMYVEYSTVHEGVTAGTVQPAVAVLPCDVPRYAALRRALTRIVDAFGVCEVEFVGLEVPQFVQVRPITRSFQFDSALARCKMYLQEYGGHTFVENDLSQTIGEHGRVASEFVELYERAAVRFFRDVLGRNLDVRLDVLHVGAQFFVGQDFMDVTRLSALESIRVFWYFVRHRKELVSVDDACGVETLLMRSYCVSIMYALVRHVELFAVREQYRRVIDTRLMRVRAMSTLSHIACSVQLASPLVYDNVSCAWTHFGVDDAIGVVVVPGDVTQGPFVRYAQGMTIPADVIVVTDYLYAEIGASFPYVRGVVCAHGSLNAHLAILAREHNVPMVIQVGMTKLETYVH